MFKKFRYIFQLITKPFSLFDRTKSLEEEATVLQTEWEEFSFSCHHWCYHLEQSKESTWRLHNGWWSKWSTAVLQIITSSCIKPQASFQLCTTSSHRQPETNHTQSFTQELPALPKPNKSILSWGKISSKTSSITSSQQIKSSITHPHSCRISSHTFRPHRSVWMMLTLTSLKRSSL